MRRLSTVMPKNTLFMFLGIFLLALAGCGSTSTNTTTLSSTAATATACTQVTPPALAFKTTTGVLKSINGQALVITNNKGNDINVTYSTTTRFTQANSVAASSLQEGTAVRIAVTSTNGTYSATSITVTTGANGNGGNGNGFGNGFPRGNGTPGANRGGNNPCARRNLNAGGGNGAGNGGAQAFRGLIGTVSQLNGNTLSITDTTGTSFTVNITAQTRIIETQSATAAALKVGVMLTAVGRADSQGTIAANTIAILPNVA